MYECYDEVTNTCDGRCQGCSDCPLAQGFDLSRRMMKLYIKKAKEDEIEWDKVIEEMHQDPEYLKYVEKLREKYKNGWNNIIPITEENTLTEQCSCGRKATRIYTDTQSGIESKYCSDCYDIESAREEGYAETGGFYSDEEIIEILKSRGWKSAY